MTDPLILPAGSLRTKVIILHKTTTTDVSGAVVSYTPLLTTRAAVVGVRGTDVIRSGQDVTQTFLTVTIRYNPAIDSSMRVQAPNGTYIIQSIENVYERNRVLRLTCLALGAND